MSKEFEVPPDFGKAIDDLVQTANSHRFLNIVMEAFWMKPFAASNQLQNDYNALLLELDSLASDDTLEARKDLKKLIDFQQKILNFISNLEKNVQSAEGPSREKGIRPLKQSLQEYCGKCKKLVTLLELEKGIADLKEIGPEKTQKQFTDELSQYRSKKYEEWHGEWKTQTKDYLRAEAKAILACMLLCLVTPAVVMLPIMSLVSFGTVIKKERDRRGALAPIRETIANIDSIFNKLKLLPSKAIEVQLEQQIQEDSPPTEESVQELINSEVKSLTSAIKDLSQKLGTDTSKKQKLE